MEFFVDGKMAPEALVPDCNCSSNLLLRHIQPELLATRLLQGLLECNCIKTNSTQEMYWRAAAMHAAFKPLSHCINIKCKAL
jgi:hypothetical protein